MVGFAETETKRSALFLGRELQRRATIEAADIVQKEMPEALFCKDRLVNLDYALGLRPNGGLLLEFGVYGGKSITHIASRCPADRIFGFDSFQGLPEQWRGKRYSPLNFDRGGVMPSVPNNVELISGWFNETLPTFLAAHNSVVSFVHIDCDLYASTKFVLMEIKDRLAEGSVIVFDEFFNYPGYRLHEYRAFQEFISETGRKFHFASFSGQQVTVVMQ
jgi:predicted O-methyltransferase YrrM